QRCPNNLGAIPSVVITSTMLEDRAVATILILDDRPSNREYLATLLGHGGHRLLQAADGAEALALAPAEHPHGVLRMVDSVLGGDPAVAPSPPAEPLDREHLRLVTDQLSQKTDELRRVNERLRALVDLGLDLGSERDPQRLLQSFCHRAREFVGAR